MTHFCCCREKKIHVTLFITHLLRPTLNPAALRMASYGVLAILSAIGLMVAKNVIISDKYAYVYGSEGVGMQC